MAKTNEYVFKNIESQLLEVAGMVIKPDLVLVEGKIKHLISYVDTSGVVRRHEVVQPFSRQLLITGVIPGHTVKVDVEVQNTAKAAIISVFASAEDELGIIGIKAEEFMQEAPTPADLVAPVSVKEPEIKGPDWEAEYAQRLELAKQDLENQLRKDYLREIEVERSLLQAEMEKELSRRWKQQFSAYQTRYGFRSNVEFGSA